MIDGQDFSAQPWPDDEPVPVPAPEPESASTAFPAEVAGGDTRRAVVGPARRAAPMLAAVVGVTVVAAGLARRARR